MANESGLLVQQQMLLLMMLKMMMSCAQPNVDSRW
jgi:hypothetical protein